MRRRSTSRGRGGRHVPGGLRGRVSTLLRRAGLALALLAAVPTHAPAALPTVAGLHAVLSVPADAVVSSPAQAAPTGSGLRGTIVDAADGNPLEGALVTVEPAPAGLLPPAAPGAPGFVDVHRTVSTDRAGRYAFPGLPPGGYRLHVQRIGYRSTSLEVGYEGVTDPRISVGLEVAPVELEPVTVVGTRPDPLPRPGVSDEVRTRERMDAERLRRARHLQPDTRVLTAADVLEAGTLGESDLFRALHRLPGVAADDDWSAEPWTRGAHWDETRVFFDGLPLRNPVHAGGAFTAVSPDAVGAVTFHPGVRPVGAGEASAGVVELDSRSAAGRPEAAALAQVSFLSARLAAELPLGPGRGLALQGRHTYIHHLTDETRTGNEVPYSFSDLGGRWDHTLGDSASLEVAGLWTRDRLFGDVENELKGVRGAWGNALARGTVELRRWGLRTRLTAGRVVYRADLEQVPFDDTDPGLADAVRPPAMENRVATDQLRLSVAPLSSGGEPPAWEVGLERLGTRVDYEGPAPWPYPGSADAGHLEERSHLDRSALWAAARTAVSDDVELSVGARLEHRSGSPTRSGSRSDPVPTLAPRVAAAWTPAPGLRVSAALGRHHQPEQTVAAAGFDLGPGLVPTHLVALARGGVPALRSDAATLGVERWLGGTWLASATAWHRRTAGRLVPRPDSGYVRARPAPGVSAPGPGWSEATGRASGLELGLRRLAGRLTGSLSWSVSRATLAADGRRFPAPGDRRHVVDANLLLRATSATRVGVTFTGASGAPYTRYYAFRCPGDRYCPPPEEGAPPVIGFAEEAHAQRLPAYLGLDLHLERTGDLLGRPYGLFVQLRNVLDRANPSAYTGSILRCHAAEDACDITDTFESGMPLLPLLGFWIRL